MPNINLYATLTDYKAYSVARGQTASTDTTDDGVIVNFLESASRLLDNRCGRQFYPSIETRLYDVPGDSELWLDADLLAVTTLTNGDTTVLTTTDYNLLPANETPKYCIRLNDISNYEWETNSSDSAQQVISVLGWWGYRSKYAQRGWQSVGTLGAAMSDTTTLTITLTAGHSAVTGQLWKIDNEIINGSVSSNTLTAIQRGDNGSTAATHLISATVYKWCPQDGAREAVLELTHIAKRKRAGRSTVNTNAAVEQALSESEFAQSFIDTHKRLV